VILFYKNENVLNRRAWLRSILGSLPSGSRILDAGAGQLRNREFFRT